MIPGIYNKSIKKKVYPFTGTPFFILSTLTYLEDNYPQRSLSSIIYVDVNTTPSITNVMQWRINIPVIQPII